VAPYSASDSKALLKAAIQDPGPVIFLENEVLYGHSFDIPEIEEKVEIGKAKVVIEGSDITIISFSIQMLLALGAAEELKQDGISAEVIDLRTIRPIDIETIITSVKKTNRLVIVEEGWEFASVGATIAALVMRHAFDYLDAPVEFVTAKDVPLPYAANLEKMAIPSLEEVVRACRRIL
jgi:pyruvate dehydrogenase E1 component beta subunit